MPDQPLTFKEMCARFEVTPRTLRYYEYIELLTPDKNGRTRSYAAREVARMVLILRGRRFGFSLEGIRQWLEIYEQKGDKAQLEVWVEMADQQLNALKEQRQQLDESISDLQKLRNEAADTLLPTH
ncbi:MerR family transcriptional regulator [Marinosulfonomonas sp. PRT-SC04]|nr:MerR family transcriptional regulator [Marinosulfonomonas sp. PRT-SC04]